METLYKKVDSRKEEENIKTLQNTLLGNIRRFGRTIYFDNHPCWSLFNIRMKLIKNNESFMVILPIQIVRAKQWKHNQPLQAIINKDGDIVIRGK